MIIGINVKEMGIGGVTPNEAFYLWSRSNGEESWKNNSNMNFLEQAGYINTKSELTDLGKDLIKKVFLPIKTSTTPINKEDVTDISLKYRELFPVNIKTGNLPVRGNIKNIERKMELFKRKYPDYSDDLILKATEKYIKEKAKEGYTFMKMSEYLIFKDGESMLASLCDAYNEGDGGKQAAQWGRTV
jgi:hypothetical protein